MTDQQQESGPAAGWESNPGADLERIYQRILEERMQGIPVINPALKVEAVDFIEWEGHWLGILLTPWFMNLMVMPKRGSPWPALTTGKGNDIALSFPQGEYRFQPRDDEGLGSYLCCSLASPVDSWKSHLEARNTARDVMRLLQTLPVRQIDPEEETEDATGCNLSRRTFLGGGEPAPSC